MCGFPLGAATPLLTALPLMGGLLWVLPHLSLQPSPLIGGLPWVLPNMAGDQGGHAALRQRRAVPRGRGAK
eukprot:7390608-Prymnesium_polylepis.1